MPHITLEEELKQIETLTEYEKVKRKRAAQRGLLKRFSSQTELIARANTSTLKSKEIAKKRADVERASILHEALNEKCEELRPEELRINVEEEQTLALGFTEEFKRLISLLELTEDRRKIYRLGTSILSDLGRINKSSEEISSGILLKKFKELQLQYRTFESDLGDLDFEEDEEIITLNSDIDQLLTLLLDRMAKETRPSPTTEACISVSSSSASVTEYRPRARRLERLHLELPKFKGSSLQWQDFIGAFEDAVLKESDISDRDKAQFLLEAMANSEAKRLVQINIHSGDYRPAVEALKKRYGKPNAIFMEHFSSMTKRRTYSDNRKDLRALSDNWSVHHRSLPKVSSKPYEHLFGSLMQATFDEDLLQKWADFSPSTKEPPTFNDLIKFVDQCLEIIDRADTLRKHQTQESKPVKKARTPVFKIEPSSASQANPSSIQSRSCQACGGKCPGLWRCEVFKSWDEFTRLQFIKRNNACTNCLRSNHRYKDCKSTYKCKTCGQQHHILLHQDGTSQSTESQLPPSSKASAEAAPTLYVGSQAQGLLATAIAAVSHEDRCLRARTIIDSGSALNLVSENLVNQLKAKRRPLRVGLTAAFEGTVAECKHIVTLRLSSIFPTAGADYLDVDCHVLSRVPKTIPPRNLTKALQLPCIKGKQPIADPELGGEADIILGVVDSGAIRRGSDVSIDGGRTRASPTLFGWTLSGKVLGTNSSNNTIFNISVREEDHLEECSTRLWRLEPVVSSTSNLTAAEQAFCEHFNDTHRVLEDGRYALRLPRVLPTPQLGESRSMAVRRYLQNEKSLKAKGQLQPFMDVLTEYVTLGHAEPVPSTELQLNPSETYYLPIHGVAKPDSTTTKLRAVFDGSAKTSSGVSFNDQLLSGLNLYPSLTSIINKFRTHAIAINGDISKMFREVVLQEAERNFHRFFIRMPDHQLQEFRMCRLTFGIKSSPFIATMVLRRLARDKADEFPEAARAIESTFYVDDFLSGAPTVQEATELQQELCNLLDSAGMTLRKWRSSSPQFLQSVPEKLRESADLKITDPTLSGKALGIHWHTQEDQFYVAVPKLPESSAIVSKRLIASVSAQLFDLMGWFAPTTLIPKILLQETWHIKLTWDEAVPDHIKMKWEAWIKQVDLIANKPISRRLDRSKGDDVLYQQFTVLQMLHNMPMVQQFI